MAKTKLILRSIAKHATPSKSLIALRKAARLHEMRLAIARQVQREGWIPPGYADYIEAEEDAYRRLQMLISIYKQTP